MENKIFDDCYQHYKDCDNNFWKDLAVKYGYSNAEVLRSVFKRERKKRGLPSKKEGVKDTPYVSSLKMPVIGVMDIEVLPSVVYVWDLYDQNVGINQIISDKCLLSWAGRFLNDSDMYFDVLTSEEAVTKNDERIAKSAWDFLSKCDVVVGHNFQQFDNKILNTAFLNYGLPPLKHIVVDTYLIAKANFRFTSGKMDFINTKLGIRNKISNEGFGLWKRCHEGDQDALDEMLSYNIGDVHSSTDMFYKFRPYIKNVNVALFNEFTGVQCPVCGNVEDLVVEGFYYTNAGKYESVRCPKCQCLSRKKENLIDKSKKKKLLVNS